MMTTLLNCIRVTKLKLLLTSRSHLNDFSILTRSTRCRFQLTGPQKTRGAQMTRY